MLKRKEISPVELARKLLERMDEQNPIHNAMITICREEALASARQAEKELMCGQWRGPLHGIPVTVKDLIATKGIPTTMGSEMYRSYIPDKDAEVVKRLKQAGAVLLGKNNTHQFAHGTTGDRSFFGPVKNALDPQLISGGSSSGSAVAVATGMCCASIGTDSGGSIRIPAAFNRVVGMKPTYGRVSLQGVYPLSPTMDHVGPITHTVLDNALVLQEISGYDPNDACCVNLPTEDFTRLIGDSIRGERVGIPKEHYFDHLDSTIQAQLELELECLRQMGVELIPVELPFMEELIEAFRLMQRSEAMAVHRDNLDQRPNQMDAEVRWRLEEGADIPAWAYIRAQQTRQRLTKAFLEAMQEVRVLVTPTVSILPTPLNQREVEYAGQSVHIFSVLNRLTGPQNLLGFPALTLPCPSSQEGRPIGLQVIGRPFEEAVVYQFAAAIEAGI